MSNLVNSITQPIGVKLLPGGPYNDNSHGDKAQQAQQAGNQQISQLIAQLANMSGVQNPQAQINPMYPNGGNPSDPASFHNPYALNQVQQGELNGQNSMDADAMNRIMSKVKANLAARGLSDSSSASAAQTYLRQKLASQVSQNNQAAAQNAYGGRMNALTQIGNLINGQTAGNVNMEQQLGQQAQQNHQNSMSQLGGLIGFATGGGFGGLGGSIPRLAHPTNSGIPQINPSGDYGNEAGGTPLMNSIRGGWQSIYGGG